jgi:DNA-binding NarL/FixJ family response regulator
MSLQIVVADDHEVVRKGLCALLENGTGWSVCGEAANGREAVEKVLALRPHVVVMDLAMPQLNGLEATRQILKHAPRTAVLVLSATESEEMVREVLKAGARGFVLKSDSGQDLVVAVDGLRRGRPFFSARVADFVVRGYLEGSGGPEEPKSLSTTSKSLTAREREVLQLLAEGKTNKEVAAGLTIQVKTAEAHRANLMRKVGVRSLGELIRYAIRNGIVEP